jgi:hypothetical protein
MDVENLILTYLQNLLKKDFIIDILSKCKYIEPEKDKVDITNKTIKVNYNEYTKFYLGKIFKLDNKFYYISDIVKKDSYSTIMKFDKFDTKNKYPLISITDKITISKDKIKNYKKNTPIKSTLGRLILNYYLLIDPFEDLIEYIDDEFKVGDIEKQIILSIMDSILEDKSIEPVYVDKCYKYLNNLFFLNVFLTICIPMMNKDCLTIDKSVEKAREKIFNQYKDRLSKGDNVAMVEVENKLIEIDKKNKLKDKDTKGYLIKSKNFDIHRKKMFLSMGMMEPFGTDDIKDYKFMFSNLSEGYDKKELPYLFNDVRKGIASRAVQTALAGAETKFLGRVFQDSKITIKDCKTKNYIELILTEDLINKVLYRNIIDNSGKIITLTPKIINKYIGKKIKLRSVMTCKVKNYYCFTCADKKYELLNRRMLNLEPIAISSNLMYLYMKSFHGTKVDLYELDSLNEFVL